MFFLHNEKQPYFDKFFLQFFWNNLIKKHNEYISLN